MKEKKWKKNTKRASYTASGTPAAHIMAQAVIEMFPEGKVTIGPPIEDGFYYDFDLPRPHPGRLDSHRKTDAPDHRRTPSLRPQGSSVQMKPVSSSADQPFKMELIDGLGKRRPG